MKIRPVRKSAPSPIPTAAEAAANPALIDPAPTARTRRGLGALVGAGLLGSLLAPIVGFSGRDAAAPTETPPTAPAVPDPADTELAARAEAARTAVTTVVAPILQKALDEEGRGAFGCVAVDPPYYLSEDEALELIEQEFAKAGMKLRRACKISGFTRTVPDKFKRPIYDDVHFSPVYRSKTRKGSWLFDFASEDGSVAVEFLSLKDARRESFEAVRSTADSYDFPELTQRLCSDFVTRTNGNPVTIGLFFDPLAKRFVWDEEGDGPYPRPGSSFAALSEEERKTLDWDQEQEILHHDARELLREQVQYFLDWARKEGCLPLEN